MRSESTIKEGSHAAAYVQLIIYTVISAVVAYILFFRYRVRFTTTDDFLMAGILGGAWGEGLNQSVVFYCSYPLTWLLSRISVMTGLFNIFGAYIMVLSVLIFSGLHWAAAQRHLSVFFHAGIVAAEYLVLGTCNWTTTAYLAYGTGIILACSFHKDMRVPERLFTWLFLLALTAGGGFLRPGVCLTTLALLLPLILHSLKKEALVRQFLGLVLAVTILVAGRATSGTDWTEHLGGSWTSYGEWNSACASFRDFTKPDPEKYAAVYSTLGWTENDRYLAFNWNYADQEVFRPEAYRTLSGVQDFTERYNCDVIDVLTKTFTDQYVVRFLMTAGAVLLMALCIWIRKKDTAAILMTILFTLGLLILLYFRKRPFLRITLPVLLLGTFEMLFILGAAAADYDRASAGKWKVVRRHLGILAEITAAGLLIGTLFWTDIWSSVSYNNYELLRKSTRSYLTEHPDNLYCMTSGIAYDLNVHIPVYGHTADKYYYNKLSLGSWDLFSPRYYDQLAAFGIEDGDHLFREIAEKDNVFIISTKPDSAEAIALYVSDHYGIESEVVVADQISDEVFVYALEEPGTVSEGGGGITEEEVPETGEDAAGEM